MGVLEPRAVCLDEAGDVVAASAAVGAVRVATARSARAMERKWVWQEQGGFRPGHAGATCNCMRPGLAAGCLAAVVDTALCLRRKERLGVARATASIRRYLASLPLWCCCDSLACPGWLHPRPAHSAA